MRKGQLDLSFLDNTDLTPVIKKRPARTTTESRRKREPEPPTPEAEGSIWGITSDGNSWLLFPDCPIRAIREPGKAPILVAADVAKAYRGRTRKKLKLRKKTEKVPVQTNGGPQYLNGVSLCRARRMAKWSKTPEGNKLVAFLDEHFQNRGGIGIPDTLPEQEGVEFRMFSGDPRIAVGDDGSVWSFRRGDWKKLVVKSHQGYKVITYKGENGQNTHVCVHRLILTEFVGPPEPGQECRHLNGIKDDNRLENLAWGSTSENQRDREQHEPNFHSKYPDKLDPEKVREIRALRDTGTTVSEIARRFDISRRTVRSVVNRETWKNVA